VNDGDDDDADNKNKVTFVDVPTVVFFPPFTIKFIVPAFLARSCSYVLQNTGKL
jgi:hypothetical protein